MVMGAHILPDVRAGAWGRPGRNRVRRTFRFAPSACDGCTREAKKQARKNPSRNRSERLFPEAVSMH